MCSSQLFWQHFGNQIMDLEDINSLYDLHMSLSPISNPRTFWAQVSHVYTKATCGWCCDKHQVWDLFTLFKLLNRSQQNNKYHTSRLWCFYRIIGRDLKFSKSADEEVGWRPFYLFILHLPILCLFLIRETRSSQRKSGSQWDKERKVEESCQSKISCQCMTSSALHVFFLAILKKSKSNGDVNYQDNVNVNSDLLTRLQCDHSPVTSTVSVRRRRKSFSGIWCNHTSIFAAILMKHSDDTDLLWWQFKPDDTRSMFWSRGHSIFYQRELHKWLQWQGGRRLSNY